MERKYPYPFEVSLEEALRIQETIRRSISFDFPFEDEAVTLLAGVDVSYDRKGKALAVVVVLSWPSLAVVEVASGVHKPCFPYIPGFLSFREGPAIERALSHLTVTPHIFFFDGQGIAHPRGVGLASHIGVLFGLVSIGVAKKPLVGNFAEPGKDRGSFSWLEYRGRRVGVVLRTKDATKPVFVSPGNRIDFDRAREWALKTSTRFRLPEPVRLAHIFSERLKEGGREDVGSLGL
ncbi:MAG: endonuclease V [Candidatus Caldatribacterium sp.]|nr:endonuclease V [Candidatus Caldatribacterium sp.]